MVSSYLTFHQKNRFMHDVKMLFWDEPYLYLNYTDGIVRRCVLAVELHHLLMGTIVVFKMHMCGYYWPTTHQNAHDFSKACDRCQRDGEISKRQKLPINPILVIKLFDVWFIDFMGPFVSFRGM